MTRRVHVVFTGGTIGSAALDGRTELAGSPPRQLLSFAPAGHEVAFTESEPLRILSEDATPEHWTEIVKHVAALDFARVDAVVVAHGSDTLAWTAKALAYALRGVPKPVVLVASDRPLPDPASNGPDNFRDALSFALSENLPGTFAVWRNPGEPATVHLATRLLPCDVHDDRFRSARGLHFGTVEKGEFRRNAVEGNPSRSHLAKAADPSLWAAARADAVAGPRFETDILVLPAQPSGDLRMFSPDQGWKAVVQLAYHSGTAWSAESSTGFLDLARRFGSAGTPVVVGPCRHGRDPYGSVLRLSQAGVLFAPSMAESALVAKVRWLCGSGHDLSRLREPIAFDLLSETNFES